MLSTLAYLQSLDIIIALNQMKLNFNKVCELIILLITLLFIANSVLNFMWAK